MAHTHPDHVHEHDDVVAGAGAATGLLITIAVIVLLAVVTLAVLFSTRPWDSDGGVDVDSPAPGIADDSGGAGGGPEGAQ